MKRTLIPLLILLLLARTAGTQDQAEIPVENVAVGTNLKIVGPSEADLEDEVRLEVVGLDPIDDATTVGELREMATSIKGLLDVNAPPEASDEDWTIRPVLEFDLLDENTPPRFSLVLWAKTAGDYVVALTVSGKIDWENQIAETDRMAHHRVRYGEIVPPPPDPAISVTPSGSFSGRGPPGGPFDPPEQVYAVVNEGVGTVQWKAECAHPWLQAIPSTGILAEGQSVECHVSFSEEAKELTAGIYVTRVDFTNEVNGKGDTFRLVSLQVEGDPVPPPSEQVWLILIYDEQQEHTYPRYVSQLIRTEEWEKLRSDPPEDDDKFREWIFDAQTQSAPLQKWVQKAQQEGWDLPVFVLTNENGDILYGPEMPASFDAAIQVVKDHLPEK